MRQALVALLLLGAVPGTVPALEFVSTRLSYGPFGAKRDRTAFMPGDVVWVNYEIDGVASDAQTGAFRIEKHLQIVDVNGKLKFDVCQTANPVFPDLGGKRISGDFHITIGNNLPVGAYDLKLTARDKVSGDQKSITYPIQVIATEFGYTSVMAPAFGMPGQHLLAEATLVGFKLSGNGMPALDITMRVLDSGENPVGTPMKTMLPDIGPPGFDFKKHGFVPLSYPLYLNRAGKFTLEVAAVDHNNGNKRVELRLPLTVVDPDTLTAEAPPAYNKPRAVEPAPVLGGCPPPRRLGILFGRRRGRGC